MLNNAGQLTYII